MATKQEKPAKIDDAEYEAAMNEAKNSVGAFTYEFPSPFVYEGEEFKALSFNFDGLTGADSRAIESEMAAANMPLFIPELSGDYLIRMAMRACTNRRADGRKLDIDAFKALPLTAYVKIRGRARSFLMRAE